MEAAEMHADTLPAALTPLVAEKRWVVWKWETTDKGKQTKTPYQAARPSAKASSTNPRTWSDYQTAARAVAGGQADGIGYALDGGEIGAFDIDNCRDRETHEISEWALPLIEAAASYTEVTVSGTGLRIIGRAVGSHIHRNQAVPGAGDGRIETYRRAERYIVVTGDQLEGTADALNTLDATMDATVASLDSAAARAKDERRQADVEARRPTISERASALALSSGPELRPNLPRDLESLIRYGAPAGADRSTEFHHVVGWLKDYGHSPLDIEATLAAHPHGIAEKYAGRLGAEVERCFQKCESKPIQHRDSRPERKSALAQAALSTTAIQPIPGYWHGDADPNADRAWLVRHLIYETGRGLLVGQWGAGKTFVAMDLCASVITGEPFAGRRVKRTGGVLFIAPEGAFEIPIRLRGIVEGKLKAANFARTAMGEPINLDRLPFTWIEECPPLSEKGSLEILQVTAADRAKQLEERFGVPLVLIIIDTVAAAAGWEDENSAAEAQKVMDALGALSRATGAFVIGVDHFGKDVQTGTRGSSAKESSADVVLAMLATRSEAGEISNTRMAVRKVRGARVGYEIPYALDEVTVGEDDEGDPITTCVVAWQDSRAEAAAATVKDKWPVSLKVLRAAIVNALVDNGKDMHPYGAEGPMVKALPLDAVRKEFSASYPADGETEAARKEAKKRAFNRAVKTAQGKALVQMREVMGVDHIWLTQAEGAHK
jgi:hypothetical protein